MKLVIELSDGRKYELNKDVYDLLPIELKAVGVGKKKDKVLSEHVYALAIDYTFRGVMNLANSQIRRVYMEKGYWGSIEKDTVEVKWNTLVDKTFIVSYLLTKGMLEENMYIADGYTKNEKGKLELNYLDDLLKYKNSKSKAMLKEQLTYVVGVFNTYYEGDYKLKYDKKDGLYVVDKQNKKISIDDIEDDFVYTYVVLSNSLLSKGVHLGVFFINVESFQENEIKMFLLLIKMFFGDTWVFLYNGKENLSLDREVLELPLLYNQ